MNGNAPFQRDCVVDKPGIVGARWWHTALAHEDAKIARRTAIRTILLAGTAIAGVGAVTVAVVKASEPSFTDARKNSLDMQRDYGWNFGAVGEPLVFDGTKEMPFDPKTLPDLAIDLAPAQAKLRPYYQPTLFQSLNALPTSIGKLPTEETAGFQPLASILKPLATPLTARAYACGQSFASLFEGLRDAGGSAMDANAAVVVDLSGPEAVAFAAGACRVFDPVFLFDNWPHPRGIVHSQDALAAAAYYQPLLRNVPPRTTPAPVMFVLDRRRLMPYSDDATQFDNRYVAKLPTASNVASQLQIKHVLYVVPARSNADRELDDLNEDFVAYAAAGIDVKILSMDMFGVTVPNLNANSKDAGAKDAGRNEEDALVGASGYFWYGGQPESHDSFFLDYPWAKPPRKATMRISSNPGLSYVPAPRATLFSSGNRSPAHPRPANFATVPIVLAAGTGAILGAKFSRSGSWNRVAGGTGG
ncbi:MAG: hypothetical protein FWD69_05415 [Polyangiaceae bacterium]|nr:hypothetical protein [Polyangiaceae bacterium]